MMHYREELKAVGTVSWKKEGNNKFVKYIDVNLIVREREGE